MWREIRVRAVQLISLLTILEIFFSSSSSFPPLKNCVSLVKAGIKWQKNGELQALCVFLCFLCAPGSEQTYLIAVGMAWINYPIPVRVNRYDACPETRRRQAALGREGRRDPGRLRQRPKRCDRGEVRDRRAAKSRLADGRQEEGEKDRYMYSSATEGRSQNPWLLEKWSSQSGSHSSR